MKRKTTEELSQLQEYKVTSNDRKTTEELSQLQEYKVTSNDRKTTEELSQLQEYKVTSNDRKTTEELSQLQEYKVTSNEELSQLQEYKDLQDEQLSKIKSLEAEVMQMRAKHSDTIQQVKSTFLKDKKEYEEDSREKINTLERLANKEAIQCLTDHTNRIKTENRQLRKELLDLINITRAYKAHQLDLQEQKKQLVREQQYAGDLKTLRTTRQHKVLKKFGMLTDNADSSDNEGTTS
ncbi:unnamed protein product [Mytilus edulis]|uniref:DUF4515 domain-containing protein n=1 Tax=Mytilus edulis TaxID=6550 RepID=A0A8S3UGE1_MYTED|nr:unnamed protein product [Mytilus edulis]